VPILLGAGMLGTVIAAGVAPAIGAVTAQANCQYGACPSTGGSSPFPWWIVAVVLAIVVVAALVGLMLFRRRPPTAPTAPEAWEPPAGASSGVGPTPPSTAPVAAAAVGGAAVGGIAATPNANYVETADDVGQSLPAVGAGAAVGGAAAAEAEPDIDSLMAELDKISGEILKKAPKPGSGGSGAADAADEVGR
jgi:hypothetical protein